jgi:ubiquinone/menaquinone biosynthesis C-methylase UbiE
MTADKLPQEFMDILCCPKRHCRGDLRQDSADSLVCAECGDVYPVDHGIPIIFPDAAHSPDMHKRHWDQEEQAKNYAKKYDSYLKKQGSTWGLYTHVSEMRAIDRLLASANAGLSGRTVIDCGCGNGRLLSYYPKIGRKIGTDSSLHLLKAAKERMPEAWLVCCQLEDMPIKGAVADLSVSIRVFQHIRRPEAAFAEMVRITKPSGFVALELYNKLNPKELYKRFRMLPAIDRLKPWGLTYDRYYSYREINKWAADCFVKPISYAGAGWGFFFYLFEPMKFRGWAPDWLATKIYDLALAVESAVSEWPVFSKTMEKISWIGSIQGPTKKDSALKSVFKRAGKILKWQANKRTLARFEKELARYDHALVGSDRDHLMRCLDWLKRAQDATPDGGVSRGFDLIPGSKSNRFGWQPSYPETTGYIIPTMIKAGRLLGDADLIRRARLMAEWEINVMLPGGAVQGGNISVPPAPAVFDTGQVIRGMIAMWQLTKKEKYLKAAKRSAAWILEHEYADDLGKQGWWNSDNASSVDQRVTTYNVYALAPLAELGALAKDKDLTEAARRSAEHTLSMQDPNGWFRDADFEQRPDALLHTIAYTIDGLWDIGIHLKERRFTDAARKALDQIIDRMVATGKIPGRFDEKWDGTVDWACLTGIAQIAVTCMKAYVGTHDSAYMEAARKLKDFLKSCQYNGSDPVLSGAVWGSSPISGEYGQYQALNWAVKYFADVLIESSSIPHKEK